MIAIVKISGIVRTVVGLALVAAFLTPYVKPLHCGAVHGEVPAENVTHVADAVAAPGHDGACHGILGCAVVDVAPALHGPDGFGVVPVAFVYLLPPNHHLPELHRAPLTPPPRA